MFIEHLLFTILRMLQVTITLYSSTRNFWIMSCYDFHLKDKKIEMKVQNVKS